MVESETITCPYCGERLEVAVDWSIREQEYVEDCQVCCQPMVLRVTVHDGRLVAVEARTGDE